jgi:hypothetical protein
MLEGRKEELAISLSCVLSFRFFLVMSGEEIGSNSKCRASWLDLLSLAKSLYDPMVPIFKRKNITKALY